MVSPPGRLGAVNLTRRDRIIVYYLLGVVLLVTLYTVTYNVAMARLEGVNQSIFASLEFVVQTMTTTGYGQDSSHWSHPLTFLFVSLTQISGIGIGFLTLRLIIIPLFAGAEVDLDSRLTSKDDHVIVCEYRRDSTVLLDELRELGIDHVLISSDEEDAKDLSDDGYAAIHGSPQDASAFERASIDTARAVITDAGDANVGTILTVRSTYPDIDVIALTDDRREVLLDAGADSVLSPHGMLGRRLAEKAVTSFGAELTDTVDLGADMEVVEIPVAHGSRLVGTRIRNAQIGERAGANIIGAWIDGELQLPPDPDAVIRPNTVLLVAGEHEELEAFSEFTRRVRGRRQHERIVIVGQGEVGRTARSVVERSGIDFVTVDIADRDEVDVVGDAGSKETLQEANVDAADAIIVCLPDDSASLLTTVLARSMNANVEVLVRVSDTDAARKASSAGADYVLSVPRVSARMVATELRGEDVLAPATRIRIIRVSAAPFAGSTLADWDIYDRTGCRVIAVEDEEGLSVSVDPQRSFTGDERLTVVGSDDAVRQFREAFDASPDEPTK